MRPLFALTSAISVSGFFWMSAFAEDSTARTYENRLTLLGNPPPLLADYPEFVEAVRELDDGRTHWVVRGPAGSHFEWDAVVTRAIRPEVLSWRTEPGAMVQHAGSAHR